MHRRRGNPLIFFAPLGVGVNEGNQWIYFISLIPAKKLSKAKALFLRVPVNPRFKHAFTDIKSRAKALFLRVFVNPRLKPGVTNIKSSLDFSPEKNKNIYYLFGL